MKKKRKAKSKPEVEKCWGCKGNLEDPEGFSARVDKIRICVSCALKLVSTL